TTLASAVANPSVSNGDTLYVEGSATSYDGINLSKRLVIIGAGYSLSGAGANAGLQANPNPSVTSSIYIDSLASGSTFVGLTLTAYLNSNVDNITFVRCSLNLQPFTVISNSYAVSNLVVKQCKAYIALSSFKLENPQVTNCIFVSSQAQLGNCINGLFRNNTLVSSGGTLNNCYVSNNIFSSSTLTFTNCLVKYNVSTHNNLPDPVANNNKVNQNGALFFVGGASADAQYQLGATSPALAAGEPINGVTPDAGAFGTADPYRLSGIPPIPTIYSLTVPASVPATATSMTITFSTRSNN
ncbi:MAG TPA: hypothetical protein VGE79_07095, partial [Niastella sp.]